MIFTGQTWADAYSSVMMPTFGTPQQMLVRGEGSHVWDVDGKEYIDLYAGIAVNALGHAHPALVDAVSTQLGTLGHVSNFFATPPQVTLAQKLLEITNPEQAQTGRVFFTNSGTESNEAALKLAKAYGNACSPAKTKIIAFEHSFHGRSTGALALTWKETYREPFAPLIPGVEFLPIGDEAAARATIDETVAAVFIEPIQGEAGVREVSDSFLQLLRELCNATGALLVIDEVQTGIARTGQWMGHHCSGVKPDVVTLAKGLAGGMPMGACIAYGAAGEVLSAGRHGSTFGGNPVCAAAALAILSEIETEGLIQRATEVGERWAANMVDAHSVVEQVRGRGLLLGIALKDPIAPAVVTAARAAGFLLNATDPRTLRVAPALNIPDTDLDAFTQALPSIIDVAQEQA